MSVHIDGDINGVGEMRQRLLQRRLRRRISADHYGGLASGAGSVRVLAWAYYDSDADYDGACAPTVLWDHIYDRLTLCNYKFVNSDH